MCSVDRHRLLTTLLGLFFFATAWAAPSGEICYLRDTDGFWQVWVTDGKGKEHTQLTRSPVEKVRCTWSGRGAKAVLVTTAAGEVLVVDRKGNERAVDLGQEAITDAASLPDGRGLLYSMPGAGVDTDDIWLLRHRERPEPLRITREPFLEHFPVPCPDGQTILYVAGQGGNDHDIYRLDLEGAPGEKLTGGQLYHFEPSCASSGAIAFSSNRSGDGNYEIWRLGPGGGDAQRLTENTAADTHPSWAPDERFLAFQSTRDGGPAVYRLDLQSSRVRRLTPKGTTGRSPVWSFE
jgi:TolB protein